MRTIGLEGLRNEKFIQEKEREGSTCPPIQGTVRKAKMRITFAIGREEMTRLEWTQCVAVLRMKMETGHRPERAWNARPRCFLCITEVTGRY